jgi:hypothetical protein
VFLLVSARVNGLTCSLIPECPGRNGPMWIEL